MLRQVCLWRFVAFRAVGCYRSGVPSVLFRGIVDQMEVVLYSGGEVASPTA